MSALAIAQSFEKLNEEYRLCSTNQWNFKIAKAFAQDDDWRKHVGQVAYRPFDRRWTVLHKSVLTILRSQVMSQLEGDAHNFGLITSRAVNDLEFAHCFVTTEPVDKIFISSKTSTNAYVFPLFLRIRICMVKRVVPILVRAFYRNCQRLWGLLTPPRIYCLKGSQRKLFSRIFMGCFKSGVPISVCRRSKN